MRFSFPAVHVEIHGLQGDFARAGEAVPHNLPAAGEQSRREPLEHRLHLHGAVLVNPAARLDVDLLARREGHFKDVAEAVQPEDAFARRAGEGVDEKASAAEQHVGRALDAGEGVFHGVSGGEPLVLAHVHALARLQMDAEHVARAVAAEGDAARPGGAGEQERHAGEHPLEAAFHRVQRDLHGGVFPEQDVVLEIDAGVTQFHVQRGHELALDVVGDAAECLVLRGGR